ncbi:MAG TPA: hypothetical protein VHF25_13535 [Nitriliruptorales bacterium]|nr:hypothetical protein [Nitriliruptorales bacterium]
MNGGRRFASEDGAIPFVVVGVAALGGVLGLAWAGQEWAQSLLREAGGELTEWVLRSAFWALDLVALQASTEPVSRDWYTPVLEGPALPIYALAALVMVATLTAEVVAGIATGNTTRIIQAIFRALLAGMLASAGGALLLAIGGALSNLGRIALDASGTGVDAPLIPLQEVLMDSALRRDGGAELFVVFLAGLVIVFTSLAIYFTLAMRPVLLAALIVFLPVAHALSVWTPMRRVQVRAWSLAFAVLLADAAILTMFAVTNTVIGQPEGVDRLIFGTFGLLLAALAPAALARVVGAPELQTAVQSTSRGARLVAVGAGALALKGALTAHQVERRLRTAGSGPGGMLMGGPRGGGGGPDGTPPTGGRGPAGPSGGFGIGGAGPSSDAGSPASHPDAHAGTAPAASQGQHRAAAPAGAARSTTPDASPAAATAAGGSTQPATGGGWTAALNRPVVGAARD